MAAKDTISDQVERFENFCVKKHGLERDFEVVFAKRDAKAVMDIELAERELESAKRECEGLSARVTRARHGNFDTTHGHRIPTQYVFKAFTIPVRLSGPPRVSFLNDQRIAGVTQTPTNVPTANKQNYPTGQGVPTRPGSLPGQSSDTVLKKQVSLEAQAHSQKHTNYDPRPEDDLSNESLTLLVQRYTDLCHERQTLQEEIEERLERKERLAKEKLRCAIIHLEMIREKAVEIVAVLNEASGGDTRVRLPAGALDETHVESPTGLVPKNANKSSPLPLAAPPSLSPAADSTMTLPVPNKTYPTNTVVTTVVGSALCPVPSTPRGATTKQPGDVTPQPRRTPSAPPQLPLPRPPNDLSATQQAIFKRYDELMKAARVSGATVPIPTVPWPLLVPHYHQYPMQNVMENNLEKNRVVGFIDLYSRWKGWSGVRSNGQPLREDWENLLSVMPEHERVRRACVARVVWILRELIPDKTSG